MKYDIELTSEDEQELHYRITKGDDEIVAGGISRDEFEAERKRGKRGKSATVFALAKQRMPELFGRGAVISEVIGDTDATPNIVSASRNTVDEVVHVIAGHDHDEYDQRIRRVEAAVNAVVIPDVTRADLMAHTHAPHEHELAPHGHQALDVRLRAVEGAVEAVSTHTHPVHLHEVIPHEHPELYKLNEAVIALAEELRETRRTFLGHDHKHEHGADPRVDELADRVRNHGHPHGHPQYMEKLPAHSHDVPLHDHGDSGVDALKQRVDEILNAPRKTVDLQVLSRENRGGRDIIIAQEL